MRRLAISALLLLTAGSLWAQQPLKPRPDAFPPVHEAIGSKAVAMAATVDDMAAWDRYPTYETYLAMMQRWAERYPDLCTIDTIGTSVRGRLILAAHIEGNRSLDLYRPQFFYSSTIHGDEVTGYVMMLRLIDTLLASYGTSQRLTDMVDETAIYINPLANPDGTYWQGNQSVQGSMRYNANWVDLNRNYPDPFGGVKAAVEPENEAMIDYFAAHSFRLSANLHGGSEVMNYPWDCFTSLQNPHPQADWWKEVCKRFVDTTRTYNATLFRDVVSSGVIAGGDWYVIHGGRQDYVNYYHNCLEVTMEVSTVKTLSSDLLPAYWNALNHSFINYIAEVYSLPEGVGIADGQLSAAGARLIVCPNPASGLITVQGLDPDAEVRLLDLSGRCLLRGNGPTFDLSVLPAGVYVLQVDGGRRGADDVQKYGRSTRIIKK